MDEPQQTDVSQTSEAQNADSFRSGIATLWGRPNVGKSSLLNLLVGDKVAIVTPRPQTTRNIIRGVLDRENAQIVFVDTPGMHKARRGLNAFMVEEARRALDGVDVVLFVLDATEPNTDQDALAAETLKELNPPILTVLNKIDLISKDEIDSARMLAERLLKTEAVLPVSAVTYEGVDELLDTVVRYLPEGPPLYPKDTLTDQPIKLTIAELIREQAMLLLADELPHALAVVVDEMQERDNGMTYIRAVLHVERNSQKGIIIGANGRMLKKIGQNARKTIEALLETRVYLDLWVKVTKNWRKQEGALKRFGYWHPPKRKKT